jgi:hypothetical protein
MEYNGTVHRIIILPTVIFMDRTEPGVAAVVHITHHHLIFLPHTAIIHTTIIIMGTAIRRILLRIIRIARNTTLDIMGIIITSTISMTIITTTTMYQPQTVLQEATGIPRMGIT